MKTCLFSLCFLDGTDKSGSSRFDRMSRFVEYYLPLRKEMGFETIVLADNGSTPEAADDFLERFPESISSNSLQALVDSFPPVKLLRLPHLEFGSTIPESDPRHHLDYPYCWRGFDTVRELLLTYDKVIFVDSDCYVLSQRLATYAREFRRGWGTLWCPKYSFPEACFQVITHGFFNRLPGPWRSNVGRLMEWALPYTEIRTDFVANRYGEDMIPPAGNMDFYGQAPASFEMRFRK